jgi:succinoglycan biosynthesis transport protein ExoP
MNRETLPGSRFSAIGWPEIAQAPPMREDGPIALAIATTRLVRGHKLKLAFWCAACMGLAWLYALTIPPSYTAMATVLLESRRPAPAPGQDAALTWFLDTNRAESEVQVIRSERPLRIVFDSLGLATHPEFTWEQPGIFAQLRRVGAALSFSPAQPPIADEAQQIAFTKFAQRLGVRRVGQSYVVEVSYTSANATLARRVANATVSAYLWQSLALKADAAMNGADFQGRVNALVAQARAALAAVGAGTLPDAATPDADARVLGAALQPLGPSSPRTGLIVTLGSVLGLMSGLFVLALGNALDRRVRTPEDLTRAAGLPCLASVPDTRQLKRRVGTDIATTALRRVEGALAAAVHELQMSILLALPHRDANHAIALVSWSPQSGCTLLCATLARMLRDSGQHVTLIDADVHRAERILTNQAGGTSLADALTNGARVNELNLVGCDGIALLPALSQDPAKNRLAFLGAPQMRHIIDDTRQRSTVVIDLPPLCVGADAKAAASYVDAVVLVAVAGRTTSDELASAVRALKSVRANVIGTVLNRANA